MLSVSIQPRTEGGWVVTLHDITERERLNARLVEQNTLLQEREEELAAQNARFDAAISNMSQGMCLYDAEQRIVFANGRYAEIYGLDARAGEAGHDPAPDLRGSRRQRRYGGGDGEKFVRDGLERFSRRTSEVIELSDGRFISVVRRPMPGGGLLTHARGHHRARAAQCPAGPAERALEAARA